MPSPLSRLLTILNRVLLRGLSPPIALFYLHKTFSVDTRLSRYTKTIVTLAIATFWVLGWVGSTFHWNVGVRRMTTLVAPVLVPAFLALLVALWLESRSAKQPWQSGRPSTSVSNHTRDDGVARDVHALPAREVLRQDQLAVVAVAVILGALYALVARSIGPVALRPMRGYAGFVVFIVIALEIINLFIPQVFRAVFDLLA